jgi:hypothetical protein
MRLLENIGGRDVDSWPPSTVDQLTVSPASADMWQQEADEVQVKGEWKPAEAGPTITGQEQREGDSQAEVSKS